jgi:20S proteasome alpha/beta subunit
VENSIECLEAANVLHLPGSRVGTERRPVRMTIGLGIRLKDGIILAADRLLSTERHQFEDDKITVYPFSHGMLFFTFADSPVTAKEVRQKIEGRISAEDDSGTRLTIRGIQEISESVIDEIYTKRIGAMPLQMLIGASVDKEGIQMWLYDGNAGFNLAGQFEILGAGESALIRYLETAYYWKDAIRDGENLAIYLVHQAGLFIPGCRGVNVVSISKDGDWSWLDDNDIAIRVSEMKAKEKQQLRGIIL